MKGFFLVLCLFATAVVTAQNFEQYRWKNRFLVLYTGDTTNAQYTEQVQSLQNQKDQLDERKVLLITQTATHFKVGWDGEWTLSEQNTAPFLRLIGLDGGVKMSSENPVTPQTIFNKIDSMPMRQAEIRRKQ